MRRVPVSAVFGLHGRCADQHMRKLPVSAVLGLHLTASMGHDAVLCQPIGFET